MNVDTVIVSTCVTNKEIPSELESTPLEVNVSDIYETNRKLFI